MSIPPDAGFDLDDLELQLLPAWAKQSPETSRYARFEGREDSQRRGEGSDRGGRRPSRVPGGDQRSPRRSSERRPGFVPRGRDGARGQPQREERREPLPPLPELGVTLVPDEKGVESLARQIKLAGRAYPMFDVAHLILKKPDRYHVTFRVVKTPDGRIAQQLWLCNLDDTVWFSEQDAVNHVLHKHFETFYQPEKTPSEPPKGTYTFVGQCGLSGAVLGPPNYHDYQNKLRKLHVERFSRMPFEAYKAKVRIVRDEAVVKKWIEEQSWKTEYNCLNVPEPKKLGTREEVEKHFREVHLASIIRPVENHTLSGVMAQQLPLPALRQLLRNAWDDQQRFPLRLVNTLSQRFAAHGLQFFKVNKTITHVAVARPHYLDMEATPVSEGIKRIVDFINATPTCTRRKLLDALAPLADSAGSLPDHPTAASASNAEPSPEQNAVVADLHWLIHQGHVLEFANGKMETAKRPSPKPLKPADKPVAQTGEPVAISPPQTGVTRAPGFSTLPLTPHADSSTHETESTTATAMETLPVDFLEPPATLENDNLSGEQTAPDS